MPLNKCNGYNVIDAPYELKLQIVEINCKGCPYFLHYNDEEQIPVLGCIYPTDLLGSHEPFLSLLEIAHNSCNFWQNKPQFEPVTIDATPGDWNDEALNPELLWQVTTQKQNLNSSEPSSISPAQEN